MKIAVIGTGYVGLVSGTCFAEIGHEVCCIDILEDKIKTLNEGGCPIYEPGLSDLLKRNRESKRLVFSSDYEYVKQANAVFLAVGTPPKEDGSANLTFLKDAAVKIAKYLQKKTCVIIKSTVPVGTSALIRELISEHTRNSFYLVSNPEFLKEGAAVEDFMRPDRVVIGYQEAEALKKMEDIYAPLLRQGNPLYGMSNFSAEMTKYAANCFLATKISFINEVARLCDVTGADIEEVRKGIASDKRIGGHFLYPGPGFGGSCFPKDVMALRQLAKSYAFDLEVVRAAEEVNDTQKIYMFKKILKHYDNELESKVFTLWGAAFKANTDDVRESASLTMACELIKNGAIVHVYDPEASENFIKEISAINESFLSQIEVFSSKYDALNSSYGLITMTEWREFRVPDFHEIHSRMTKPVIFDARNLYDTEKVLEENFEYYAIGKKIG